MVSQGSTVTHSCDALSVCSHHQTLHKPAPTQVGLPFRHVCILLSPTTLWPRTSSSLSTTTTTSGHSPCIKPDEITPASPPPPPTSGDSRELVAVTEWVHKGVGRMASFNQLHFPFGVKGLLEDKINCLQPGPHHIHSTTLSQQLI